MTITLNLSEEQLTRLKRRAEAEGVTTEECALTLLETALTPAENAFHRAAEATFSEHAEAYRRLAK